VLSELYRMSATDGRPLRIGLLLDDTRLSQCFYRVIEDIQKSNFAEVKLLVLRQDAQSNLPEPRASLPVRAWRILRDARRRRGLFYWWYTKLDRKWVRCEPDPSEPADCTELLQGVERLAVTPIGKGFTHRFSPAAIERIRAADLDVILRFGFQILRGEILQSARCGVWSFHHGDNDHYRGGPPYFWELVEEASTCGAVLQVLTEELDAGLVLAKVVFSAQPGLSLQRNRWAPYWGSSHMVIRKLNELHRYGWDRVRSRAVTGAPYHGKRRIYRTPSNLEMVRWLAPRIVSKAVARPFRKPCLQHWRIGVRANGPAVYLAAAQGDHEADLTGFRWIDSPRGHFQADPFLFARDGLTWAFFEDFDYRQNRGVINVAELRPDCTFGEVRTCLDLPFHVSFPNVFAHDGEVYMIPETNRNGTVELHRAIRFPYEWKLEKVLFRGNLVDTSPWFDGRLWWFFVGIAEPASHVAVSMLFYADSLTGDWTAHPSNPVSTDVRSARNAGAVFSVHGRLFRPSQDCAGAYGRSVSFNEVTTLNPEEYAEQAVPGLVLHPSSGFDGMHTYNFCGPFEVIDAVRREPRAALL
jgi:hypothetical protein